MSRLQRKCVFGSAAVHCLLLALLVVSSAFVTPPPKPENIKFIKIFDASKITDDATQGGGNPDVPRDTPQPQAPVVQQQQIVEPTPPVVTPQPVEPPTRLPEPQPQKIVEPPPAQKQEPVKKETKKEVVKDTPKPPKKQDTQKIVKTPNGKKPVHDEVAKVEPNKPEKKIDVDLTVKRDTVDPNAQRKKLELQRQREREIQEAREAKERQEQERRDAIRRQMELTEQANRMQRERMQALNGIVGKIENGTRSTTVEMPGPGGEAFINYADAIWTRYYQAWQTPDGQDSRSSVKVEIVVARDGRILSSNIIRPSGNATLDKSVRQALDRVTKLPAFPEGAKDAQRTFKINFELKSKHQFG